MLFAGIEEDGQFVMDERIANLQDEEQIDAAFPFVVDVFNEGILP
jgi:hypothetical protein